jgi:hypothetical protein
MELRVECAGFPFNRSSLVQRENGVSGLEIPYELCISGKSKQRFKTSAAFRAVPKMTDERIVQIF